MIVRNDGSDTTGGEPDQRSADHVRRATEPAVDGYRFAVTEDDPAGVTSRSPGDPLENWATATVQQLADGLRRGHPPCLEETFRRWSPVVHTLATRALGDRHDADDVTQQVFVSVWRSRAQFDSGAGSLPGWVIGIAQHRIADLRRVSGRQARLHSAVSDQQAAVPYQRGSDATVDRLLIASELRRLPHPKGAILQALYYDDHTYQEIADRMALPLGTVKSHARRALKMLHERLREVTA